MKARTITAVVAGAGLVAGLAVGVGIGTAGLAGAGGPGTRATLRDPSGTEVGTVRFKQADDRTEVRVQIRPNSGVGTDAFHGFHIHANADGAGCSADPAQAASTWFTAVGGPWKADGQNHAGHLGDLPSLYVNADGTVEARFTVDRLDVAELPGRAVILHAGADNFGNVPMGSAPDQYSANSPEAVTKTQNTGNAGDRVACGIVGES